MLSLSHMHTIAKNCFICSLGDRFTQRLLNHVFDRFSKDVMNRPA